MTDTQKTRVGDIITATSERMTGAGFEAVRDAAILQVAVEMSISGGEAGRFFDAVLADWENQAERAQDEDDHYRNSFESDF